MGEALTIRVRRERGYAVVTVAGEVDIATVAQLREPLFELAAGGRPLVVDLDQVSFIDASGLGALVGAARRAARHGAGLHAVCGRPQTVRLFRLTGLDHQIPLARSLDEALGALAAGRGTPALAVSPAGAAPARRPGRRAGLQRGLDGGRGELRGLRVGDDVPAEQDAADGLPGMRGRVVRADGGGGTGGIGLGHTRDCRRNGPRPAAGHAGFVTPFTTITGAAAARPGAPPVIMSPTDRLRTLPGPGRFYRNVV
jgi:anti-sigma B factor antagonist